MSGFQTHVPALRAWFSRRLRNPADIDDAVQDVWLRVQANIGSERIANLQAYMFTTAQSVIADRARRAAVRREGSHVELQDRHHPVEEITPERVLMSRDSMARTVARIQSLPERTRDIFVLHRFEAASYGDIAKSMGISVSAVEKHIMKALRLLVEEEE